MTMTPTENERSSYECGYRDCCHENGLPYVRVERTWNNFVRFSIEYSDKTLQSMPSQFIDAMVQDIARRVANEYDKFKQKEHNEQYPDICPNKRK